MQQNKFVGMLLVHTTCSYHHVRSCLHIDLNQQKLSRHHSRREHIWDNHQPLHQVASHSWPYHEKGEIVSKRFENLSKQVILTSPPYYLSQISRIPVSCT